jgi:glyoxylase-like metal-dependent hydrolase (beta-lactamase superfamily II)
MKTVVLILFLSISAVFGQTTTTKQPEITVRITKAAGSVYFLDCEGGFGGGNVAASIGDDGILLVDDMFAAMGPKVLAALKTISDKPVKMVLNTHFHGDHIQGNKNFQKSSVIVAQENVRKRLLANNKDTAPTLEMLPAITFTDRLAVNFNGEEVQMIHYPNGHTDGDSVIYFTKSKVLHLGDMFFFEMFPAVYTEGGGNIRQLVVNLDKVIADTPADAKVVPGHGNLATMQDLKNYVSMLKETIGIVDTKIKEGKTLEQMTNEKVLAKYDTLGSGGAQTTDQYLAMLFKLLSADKK